MAHPHAQGLEGLLQHQVSKYFGAEVLCSSLPMVSRLCCKHWSCVLRDWACPLLVLARQRVLQISMVRVGNSGAPPENLTAVEREQVCWTNIYPFANTTGNANAGVLLKSPGWNKCQDLQQTADITAAKQFAFSGDQNNLAIQMALHLNCPFTF